MDWKALNKDWKKKRPPEELINEPKKSKKNDARKRISPPHDWTGKCIRDPILGLSKRIVPSKQDINFYFLWADYEYDSSRACTVIHMYGRMEETNASIQVQVSGFSPHFYIRRPKGWDDERIDNLITMLDGHLKACLKESHSKNYELMQVCKDHDRLIKNWKSVSGEELVGVWGSDPVDFIDVYMHHPKMVKHLKEMIFYPNGKAELKEVGGSKVPTQIVPSWCPSSHYEMISTLQIYEADVDFIVRFIVDTGFKPSSWFSLPRDRYTLITEKRNSRCELEAFVKLDALTPLTDDIHQRKTPDLIELDFDIEVATTGPFPDPKKALFPITKISFVQSTTLDSCCRQNVPNHECPANGSCKVINYVFSLLKCKTPPNADDVFCYDTEVELLEAMLDFLYHVDPDIFSHHNGNGFDIQYLIKRAQILGIDVRWDFFGRSHKKKVYCKSHSSKGFKKWAAAIPGVFNLDILRLAQDDTKLEAHNLQKLSESYLGESKEEIHHTLMAKYQETAEGREKLSKYNMKDSILVNKIRKKKKYVQNCLGMGSSYVLAQINADRAQGAKIEPQLRLECNREARDKDGFIIKRRQFKVSQKRDEKRQNISYAKHEADASGKTLKRIPAKRQREDPGQDDDEDREYDQRYLNHTAIAEAALLEASLMDADFYEDHDDEYEALFESQKKLFDKKLFREEDEDDSYAGATVLKPRCGYYPDDIIITLDFAGMYPSIIRRWNLCFSTLITIEVAENMIFHRIKRDAKGNRVVNEKGQPVWEDFKLEKSYYDKDGQFIEKDYFQVSDFKIEEVLDKDGNVIDKKLVDVPDPKGACFLTSKFKRGTLPAIEDDLAITRALIKKDMEIVKREMERINIVTGINELTKTIDALNKNLADAKKAGTPTSALEAEIKSLQGKISVIKKSPVGDACADVNASYPSPTRDPTNLIRPLWLMKKILAGETHHQKEFDIFKDKTVAQWLKELDRDYSNMDIQQNAKKLSQNSVYGLTGDKTSQYYQKEIATTVTAMGRRMIATIKLEVERTYCKKNGYWWDSIVIYGDTDSVFVWLKGFCKDPHEAQARGEAACIGTMMADSITKKCFIPPIKLDYEKLYTDFVLLGPKNYFGCKWLINELTPKLDIKGLQMIKRGPPLFIKESCKKAIEILIMERDYEKALNYAAQRRDMLSSRLVAICDLIQRQKISKPLSSYGKETEVVNKKTGKVIKKTQSVPKFVNLALRILKEHPDREIDEGTILSLVHVDQDPKNFAAKSKKVGDRTEEPMTVLLEQIPIDIDFYLTSFDKNMVKILSYPVLHKDPLRYSYTELTPTGIQKSKLTKEEDFRYEKARLEKKLAPIRKKIRAIKISPSDFPDNALEKLTKTIEVDTELLAETNVRLAELEKMKKRKVLNELHSRCKKSKIITPLQEKSALAKSYSLEKVCTGCSSKIPDPNMHPTFWCMICEKRKGKCTCPKPQFEAPPCGICEGELGKCSHRRSGNSSELCQYCDLMLESITEGHAQTLSKLEAEHKQIWDTCAKCMATSVKEDLESCIAVECRNLGRRTMIDREISTQKATIAELVKTCSKRKES